MTERWTVEDVLLKFLSLKPTEDYVPTADEITLAEDGSDW